MKTNKGHERVISDEIELLKPSSSSSSSSSSIIPMHQITHRAVTRHFTSRQVKLIIAAFALRLLFTGLIWDHFVHKYHDLLMVLSSNPRQRVRHQYITLKHISKSLINRFFSLLRRCKFKHSSRSECGWSCGFGVWEMPALF
jgi:hypothetical protein